MTKHLTGSAVREASKPTFYDHSWAPLAFDLLIGAVFVPFGGIHRLRSRALDFLDLRPGLRVLELGCGTGGITRLLLKRGVAVIGVDGSEQMLARAQKRAPEAQFFCSRLEEFEPTGSFDRVFLAFVLHELSAPDRQAALAAARRAVTPDGVVAVLDWAAPRNRKWLSRAWRWFLRKLEPPTVVDCLERGFEAELVSHDLQIVGRYSLAVGTAQLILGRPAKQFDC
jgi:ubiquinone/menaquinone biosynthesis C-methylase UbiE